MCSQVHPAIRRVVGGEPPVERQRSSGILVASGRAISASTRVAFTSDERFEHRRAARAEMSEATESSLMPASSRTLRQPLHLPGPLLDQLVR